MAIAPADMTTPADGIPVLDHGFVRLDDAMADDLSVVNSARVSFGRRVTEMNFVSLRAAETAQREIRRYAEAVEQLFAERMPVTHEAFVASGRVAP